MARKAVFPSSSWLQTVENIIEAADGFTIPGKVLVTAPAYVDVGWTYNGSAYSAPEVTVPVPEVITRYQAREALRRQSLLSTVTALVGGSSEEIQLKWSETTEWRRDNATLITLATALGLTSEQIDDLFRAAAQITA